MAAAAAARWQRLQRRGGSRPRASGPGKRAHSGGIRVQHSGGRRCSNERMRARGLALVITYFLHYNEVAPTAQFADRRPRRPREKYGAGSGAMTIAHRHGVYRSLPRSRRHQHRARHNGLCDRVGGASARALARDWPGGCEPTQSSESETGSEHARHTPRTRIQIHHQNMRVWVAPIEVTVGRT